MSKTLAFIKENTDLLTSYVQGLGLLERSQVLAFLRERSIVRISDGGESLQKSAAEAHRSLGYNEALDDLINFVDKFVRSHAPSATLQATYDAVNMAFKANDLLPEEVDAIRNNTKPNYPGSTKATNINR